MHFRPLILACILGLTGFSQDFHSPLEVLKLLTDSELTYDIGMIEESSIEPESGSEPLLLDHGLYLEQSGRSQKLQQYRYPGPQSDVLAKAEAALQAGQTAVARESYLGLLNFQPKNSQIMTYVGQTFGLEGSWAEAEKAYLKAIDLNFIDYMAHWFLSDVYLRQGKNEEALQQVILAHLLNRNNPRIFAALNDTLRANGSRYDDWVFHPIYRMSKVSEITIRLEFEKANSVWLPYVLVKALWAFEPGYRESMLRNTTELPRLIEEKECLLNVMAGHANKHGDAKSDVPAINKLIEATHSKNLSNFILYECLLREDPSLAFRINPDHLEALAAYLRQFRIAKM